MSLVGDANEFVKQKWKKKRKNPLQQPVPKHHSDIFSLKAACHLQDAVQVERSVLQPFLSARQKSIITSLLAENGGCGEGTAFTQSYLASQPRGQTRRL